MPVCAPIYPAVSSRRAGRVRSTRRTMPPMVTPGQPEPQHLGELPAAYGPFRAYLGRTPTSFRSGIGSRRPWPVPLRPGPAAGELSVAGHPAGALAGRGTPGGRLAGERTGAGRFRGGRASRGQKRARRAREDQDHGRAGELAQAGRAAARPGPCAMHISTRAWLVRELQFAITRQLTIYSSNILLVFNCGYRLRAAPGTGRRSCRPEQAMSSS
jgi:hypothetical protein